MAAAGRRLMAGRVPGRLRSIVFSPEALGVCLAVAVATVAHLVTRPPPLPPGQVEAAACGWRGDDVVVSGVVRNLGSSGADFLVTPAFSVVGVGTRGARATTDVYVPAGAERAWLYVRRDIAPRRSGMPIGCFPSVRAAPRPGRGEHEGLDGD
jgi:hypothetical protein